MIFSVNSQFFIIGITPSALNESRTIIRQNNFNSFLPTIRAQQFSDSFTGFTFIVEKKKNVDLIRPIHLYYRSNNFEFRHINSHTGLQDEHSLGNEEADRLATNSISN